VGPALPGGVRGAEVASSGRLAPGRGVAGPFTGGSGGPPSGRVSGHPEHQGTDPGEPRDRGPNLTLLPAAPGVQRVVERQLELQQSPVIGLDVAEALRDGQQAGRLRRGVLFAGDVGAVDDLRHAAHGRIRDVERLDQDLEGALPVAVRELGAGRVEGARSVQRRVVEDLVGRDVDDLGVSIDEAADQPRAGDPVGLRPCPGDPLNDGLLVRSSPVPLDFRGWDQQCPLTVCGVFQQRRGDMVLRRAKTYLIGAGGMLALVLVMLLPTGWGSAVAAPMASVFVTNDPAHPVPVAPVAITSGGGYI